MSGAFLFGKNPHDIDRGAFLKIGQFGPNREFYRDTIVQTPFILMPDKVQELLDKSFAPPKQGFENGSFSAVAIYDYLKEAIRELVVNALAHKDYRYHEPVTVSVYPDRLEVFNFGILPAGISASNLKGVHPSIRRNTALSEVFFAAGFVENWALGIKRVVDACKANGNPEPMFEEMFGGVKATIWIRSNKKHESIDIRISIDDKSKAILSCMSEDPSISVSKISEVTGISSSTINRRIKSMLESGILRREGSDKSGKWIISY